MSAVEQIHLKEATTTKERNGLSNESTAVNILAMLRQAADAAKRNEERARAQAVHWQQQFQLQKDRARDLENALHLAEERAADAEQWIQRIYHNVKDNLLGPLVARSTSAAPDWSKTG